ncbi:MULTISPECIES: hypothetical protein [unclassified Microbacterium]|uniref:hypothetical protein n=1 Tax=unclassified Microbacterium TaxID=2609290 RepID=UPI000C2C360E|nr:MULTISPECIES: hypothetical protein [unclassified Microbacterium]
MGFSLAGLAVSLAVLAPNALLIFFRPVDAAPPTRTPRPLTWLERAGQALCLVTPALTGQEPGDPWWFAAVAACIAVYLGLRVRYLATGRHVASLYAPLGPVPVPMALFPIAAFLSAAGWLGSWWIALAATILAAGHIPIAVATERAIHAPSSPLGG